MSLRPQRSYLVCATQRSGSTLLCELLKATGVAGCPEEYFEAVRGTGVPPHPGSYLEGLPRTGAGIRDDLTTPEAPPYSSLEGMSDYRVHLDRSFARGTGDNGVFGAKLMFNQLPELQALAGALPEYAGLDVDRLISRLFGAPTFVWVRREDTVRQAVSLWKALQNRRWRGGGGDPAPLRYRFDGIDHLVKLFRSWDEGWSAFFARRGVDPLRISYEGDLERDPEATVRTVLQALDIPAPPDLRITAATQRQADAISEEWVSRYRRESAATGMVVP